MMPKRFAERAMRDSYFQQGMMVLKSDSYYRMVVDRLMGFISRIDGLYDTGRLGEAVSLAKIALKYVDAQTEAASKHLAPLLREQKEHPHPSLESEILSSPHYSAVQIFPVWEEYYSAVSSDIKSIISPSNNSMN
ncbi:hypothetical protein JW711_04420 [Candidatus Woesearchaeota archaeon]|nr:hypothetical protein [Candidatus Woesearchaeota archaeon]